MLFRWAIDLSKSNPLISFQRNNRQHKTFIWMCTFFPQRVNDKWAIYEGVFFFIEVQFCEERLARPDSRCSVPCRPGVAWPRVRSQTWCSSSSPAPTGRGSCTDTKTGGGGGGYRIIIESLFGTFYAIVPEAHSWGRQENSISFIRFRLEKKNLFFALGTNGLRLKVGMNKNMINHYNLEGLIIVTVHNVVSETNSYSSDHYLSNATSGKILMIVAPIVESVVRTWALCKQQLGNFCITSLSSTRVDKLNPDFLNQGFKVWIN